MSSTVRDQFWLMLPTRDDLAVADVPDGAVDVAHPGDPQAHRLDGPDGLAEVDLVAHAVLVLDDHEDAGEEVADQALGAEAERDADDAGAGDDRADVDPDLAEHHRPEDGHDDAADDALEQAAHGLGALDPAAGGGDVLGVRRACRAERAQRHPVDARGEHPVLRALRPGGRRVGAGSTGPPGPPAASPRSARGFPISQSANHAAPSLPVVSSTQLQTESSEVQGSA